MTRSPIAHMAAQLANRQPHRTKWTRVTPELRQVVLSDLAAGKTYNEIAAARRTGRSTISKIIREAEGTKK